tara:strand:- start:14036 stop:14971 length:936 start_codon:yes stop_codon:yes gene_type:complete
MKFDNRLIWIIVASVGLYGVFLFFSDFNQISQQISIFKYEFLPLILALVSISWIPLLVRWQFLLKKNKINIPTKNSFLIFLGGISMAITPGHVGELIKSQLIKNNYNIPRTKTAPIIFIEKFYDLTGAIIASIIGIIILEMDTNLIIFSILVLSVIIFLIFYKPIFEFLLKRISKTKLFSKYSDNIVESYEIIRNSTTTKTASISFGLSILYWIIISIAVYFILLSFGIESVSLLRTISIYSSSVIIGALSFIPGGIGVTEGSLIGLFSLEGIEISMAIFLSVMIRIFTMWYSVCIGFICLKFTGGLSKIK